MRVVAVYLPWGCVVWRRWVALPRDAVWGLGESGCGLWLCAGAGGQERCWSGFCPATGCWRRAEQGCVGYFQLFRGSRFANCCFLARGSMLWGKHPKNPLVTLFPGFLGDGAVWL